MLLRQNIVWLLITQYAFSFSYITYFIIYCSKGLTKVLEYLYLVNEHKLYQDSISRKLHILVLNYAYTVSFTERRKQRVMHIYRHIYIQTPRHIQQIYTEKHKCTSTISHINITTNLSLVSSIINESSSFSFCTAANFHVQLGRECQNKKKH